MTRVVDGILVISPEPDSRCDDCGKVEECRPYGLNGTSVCYQCAMRDPDGTDKRMRASWKAQNVQLGAIVPVFLPGDDDR